MNTDLNEKTHKQFIREMFAENGNGSSKRLIGFICLMVVMFCTIHLTITSGACAIVENILQTITISACALLGVSSVTKIWSKNNKNKSDKEEGNDL